MRCYYFHDSGGYESNLFFRIDKPGQVEENGILQKETDDWLGCVGVLHTLFMALGIRIRTLSLIILLPMFLKGSPKNQRGESSR